MLLCGQSPWQPHKRNCVDEILKSRIVWRLTHSTRTFIRRSMLVLLKVLFPQFCISFVSWPADEEAKPVRPHIKLKRPSRFVLTLSPPTCKQHQPKAPVGVSQSAAAQKNLLVVQRVFLTSVHQRPCKSVQAVVGWFAAYLTLLRIYNNKNDDFMRKKIWL